MEKNGVLYYPAGLGPLVALHWHYFTL